MREILFRGKTDKGEWVKGTYYHQTEFYGDKCDYHYIIETCDELEDNMMTFSKVIPETVGQYTEMKEFVVSDRAFNKPLFEGDIVEVWSKRRIPTSYYYSPSSSQYDVEVKARAVICFKYGKWFLDYDNEYNKSLCELRGNEQMERTVESWSELDHYRYTGNEKWYREHNSRCKHHDIVKIGNIHDNPELLKGGADNG